VKLLLLLAVVILAALPWFVGSYLITVMIFIFFYAYLGQAWNIVGGYAGQLSAGHAAFENDPQFVASPCARQVDIHSSSRSCSGNAHRAGECIVKLLH